MKGYGYEKRRSSNWLKKIGIIIAFPFFILIIGFLAYKLFFIPAPTIEGLDAFSKLPAEKSITLQGSNVKSIHIFISQKGSRVDLLKDAAGSEGKVYTLQIKPREMGLSDGPATVTVQARSGIIKEVRLVLDSIIDTVPPSLSVVSRPTAIDAGSNGYALLRAKDADSVYVTLDGMKFPAFASGKSDNEDHLLPGDEGVKSYHVFFPAPFDSNGSEVYHAVAEDSAGNQKVKALLTKLRPKSFGESTIEIDDSFINTVIAPLLGEVDVSEPVSAFRRVNEVWREESLARLREIANETTPEILWEGAFVQMKNSKVMATYGERRTYNFRGESVSRSVHLGYDLASVTHAPVQAANSGRVRFAGEIGIYGQTVIIDHGCGLMSLYGHLSSIMVRDGEQVSKGDIIAETGSTGLAGGDHLHFGILVHGYEVSPLYWWDAKWVRTNVLDRMGQ